MSEIRVRPARAGELDLVGELTVTAYLADNERMRRGEGYASKLADAATRASEAELLVAVDPADQVLGTVTVIRFGSPFAQMAGPGEVEFRMLAVDPAARGRGVGQLLVTAVLDRARAAGADRVVLFTMEWMQVAQRLYRRHGFQRAPDRDVTRPTGAVLLAYTLALAAP